MGGSPLLLVESNPRVRDCLRRVLPADVACAQDAEEALELFARQHPRRVVVGDTGNRLVDERLALLQEIATLDPKAYVAVLILEDDPADLARAALRLGAFATPRADADALRRVVAEMDREDRARHVR